VIVLGVRCAKETLDWKSSGRAEVGDYAKAALAVVPGPQGTATSSPAAGTAPAPPSTTPTRKANASSHPENGAESVLTPAGLHAIYLRKLSSAPRSSPSSRAPRRSSA
jgi:hypothetical protein